MTVQETLLKYLEHMQVTGRAEKTIRSARIILNLFIRFLNEQSIKDIEDIADDCVAEYQQELAFRTTARGTLLSIQTQILQLGTVRVFTRYLKDEDYLLYDPGAKIHMPRKPRKLPKVILTQADIKKLISSCDNTSRGFRNRIVMEILYDTAIRRAELKALKIQDMNLDSGYVHVTGKGDKDRVVPMSQKVCELVQQYIYMVRPMFLRDAGDTDHLILNRWGKQMTGSSLLEIIKRCRKQAGIKKNITIHTFRHTCVTHMLRNGAPIRHLQQMLGHESLESTQLYTHVTINDLKEIHARYHPSGSTDI